MVASPEGRTSLVDGASHRRAIRSYVRREGRLTAGQQQALETLWPKYGIELVPSPLDFASIFGRTAPLTLEIGFGNGETLIALATQAPEQNFVGVEVYRPGIGRLLKAIDEQGLKNIRAIAADAVAALQHVAEATLDQVLLLFPDPWPKKRHHKRRIVQPPFVKLLATKIRAGGLLRIATDWQDYAEHMLAVMAQSPDFERLSSKDERRPVTKFERRAQRLGHGIWDLAYRRR